MKLDIIGKRKIFFGISIVALVLVLIITIVVGPKLDIQFKGGSIATYTYTGDITPDEFGKTVESFLGQDVTVQKQENSVTGQTSMVVSLTSNKNLTTETQTGLLEELQITYADNEIEASDINNVDPVMGMEFFKKCIVAVVFASVIMIVYISFRFRKIGGASAGVVSVIALIHDVLIAYGVFVLLGFTINDNFIAVVLTILGYSINDTIVIYDRIRENKRYYGNKMELGELVNMSINQCLRRTVTTSLTTVMALICICVVAVMMNVSSILSFAVPMMVGVISGLYSSVFLSGSLWTLWQEKKAAKAAKA
ncbi:protein translocase subunit SecF [Negativibacillus massiliensis]|uniref:protein translocase subunit SecF n=1 Tax=Negativibacillus massiliensis TaxID=1871035 RepID=UPI003AF80089